MWRALQFTEAGAITSTTQNPDLAQALGVGTEQLESLGVWMRLVGLAVDGSRPVALTPLGRLLVRHDTGLMQPATWWVIHWQLSANFSAWTILTLIDYGLHTTADLDSALRNLARIIHAW